MGLFPRSRLDLAAGFVGRVSYDDGLSIQEGLRDLLRCDDAHPDCLIQLEHEAVYTVGRRGDTSEILWSQAQLADAGIEVRHTDRGGKVTYHGPGQLVGYPIIRLSPTGDLVGHIRKLEQMLIEALHIFGVRGERVDGRSGVWVGDSKIAAIGIRVSRGLTKHGFALNVDCDLSHFRGIIPCGITDKGVTSMAALGVSANLLEVAEAVQTCFLKTFDYENVVALKLPQPVGAAATQEVVRT